MKKLIFQTIYNDCHNNKMTINLFLNEECKNAMNLKDFVNNLKISIEDLKYSSTNGFVDGVTNIFTKQLKDMDPTERPIHCSDKKRLQFYVKDNNKWKKDEDGKKMDETITTIKLKQTTKLENGKNYILIIEMIPCYLMNGKIC